MGPQGPTDHLGPSFDQVLGPTGCPKKTKQDENKTSIQIRDIPAAFCWSVLFCSLNCITSLLDICCDISSALLFAITAYTLHWLLSRNIVTIVAGKTLANHRDKWISGDYQVV
jgi:hypothetical protein